MSDTSGLSSRTPWAFLDPDGSWVRTWPATSLWASTESSLTLPASGMTLAGRLYELPMSAPATDGPDSSSLLPTPVTGYTGTTVDEWKDRRPAGNGQRRETVGDLGLVVGMLPTPTAGDAKSSRNATSGRQEGSQHHAGTTLTDAVTLLPTPSAGNFNDGESVESWKARQAEQAERGINGNGMGTPLAMAVKMLPTPSAADGLGGHERRGGDRGDELLLAGLVKDVTLLPTPAAWDGDRGPDYARMGREDSGGDDLVTTMARLLPTPTVSDAKEPSPNHGGTTAEAIGALTAPPSPATPPSSVDPHPTLWTLEDD